MRTRLSRSLEQKTKKRLILNVLGIIIVLFLFVRFGLPLLINISLFFTSSKGSGTTSQSKNAAFITPPSFIENFTATNSASIQLSGTAPANMTVQLFADNALMDTTESKKDGTFIFDNVHLHDGQNTFTVKAKHDTKESDFSDPLMITFVSKAPNLTIDAPSDNQTFSKDDSVVTVKGTVDANVKVTVNGFWAIMDDKGNYSYDIHLQNGDNQVIVDATDAAGNKTEKTLKITLSQ